MKRVFTRGQGNFHRPFGRECSKKEYWLEILRADDSALFNDGVIVLNIQPSTGELLSWKALDPALARVDPAREPFGHAPDHIVSMVNYYRMEALLRGVLDMKKVHYVNAQYLSV